MSNSTHPAPAVRVGTRAEPEHADRRPDWSDSSDVLYLNVPELSVSAGAGGARLSIRLLRPTQLALVAGCWSVVHDPVGLAGPRLLAWVYRAVADPARIPVEARQCAPPLPPVRWVLVRPPLGLVCAAADQLSTRAWRAVPSAQRVRRVQRVAESTPGPARPGLATPEPTMTKRTTSGPTMPALAMPGSTVPGVLLLSESHRADAVSHTAAGRLVLRAVRQRWAVLATTRDAPMTARLPEEATSTAPQVAASAPVPPWRSHWMCERGMLVPCRPALD